MFLGVILYLLVRCEVILHWLPSKCDRNRCRNLICLNRCCDVALRVTNLQDQVCAKVECLHWYRPNWLWSDKSAFLKTGAPPSEKSWSDTLLYLYKSSLQAFLNHQPIMRCGDGGCSQGIVATVFGNSHWRIAHTELYISKCSYSTKATLHILLPFTTCL